MGAVAAVRGTGVGAARERAPRLGDGYSRTGGLPALGHRTGGRLTCGPRTTGSRTRGSPTRICVVGACRLRCGHLKALPVSRSLPDPARFVTLARTPPTVARVGSGPRGAGVLRRFRLR
ncbi:hypothetical protein GCM10010293_64490 [Streptomyces griseoflavus]|nr:hypothetical protein GCM10010293_64490 [Streptomyces griseoflavus]